MESYNYNHFEKAKENHKRIWILNHHAHSFYFDEGGRHYNFAKYLKINGYEPVIFCSNAQHGTGGVYFPGIDLWEEHIAEKIDVPFVFIKGRPYVGNGKERILCMIDYYRNVKKTAKEYVKTHGYPDVIIGSSVHPLAVLAGEQLAKKYTRRHTLIQAPAERGALRAKRYTRGHTLIQAPAERRALRAKRYRVPCICEIRDLWPESIVAVGMASKYNPLIIGMRALEKKLYKDANAIIFTMEGGYDYIVERRWEKEVPRKKVHYINNGIDLDAYKQNISEILLDDPDLNNDENFKIVYAGSVRRANGIDELIDGAICLRDNDKIKFLIYGDGDYINKVKKRVKENKLNNVIFKGRVEKRYIPYILSKSDLNLLNYNAAAAAGFYRFGSSQNKLFEYLASGRPLISNFKPGYDLIEKYQCGISQDMLDGETYAKTLKAIVEMEKEQYEEMCRNAKRAAMDFDFKILTGKLINIIENESFSGE